MEELGTAQRQNDIIDKLANLMAKLEQTQNQIMLLRLELGMDGIHGRIPIAEATLVEHRKRMDNMDEDIDTLKHGVSESVGKNKLLTTIMGLAGGGGAVGLIELMKVLLK